MRKVYGSEEEIDLKEIFALLYRYRRSILAITLLVAMATGVKLYFDTPVYQARSLIQITPKLNNYGTILHEAVYPEIVNSAENELAIFKSSLIARKVLKELNLGTRYYKIQGWKEKELYKASPFRVTVARLAPELEGKEFILEPIDAEHFRLQVTPDLRSRLQRYWEKLWGEEEEKPLFKYRGIHRYGEKIDLPQFSLVVHRMADSMDGKYAFTVRPNSAMASWIKGGIQASVNSKTGNVVSLSFNDTVASRAVEVLQKIIDAYIQSNIDYKAQSAKKQLDFVQKELQKVAAELQQASQKLEGFKSNNKILDIDQRVKTISSRMSEYESKLFETNLQISSLRRILKRLEEGKNLERLALDYPQGNAPVVESLLQQFQSALADYSALSVAYTTDHPQLRALRKKIASLKRSLLETLRGNLNQLQEQQERLSALLKSETKRLQAFPDKEQQLGQLSRIFMVKKKIYTFLLEKRSEVEIERSSIVPRTRVLDQAELVGQIRPKTGITLLVGFILGLLLGIAQAFIRAWLGNKVMSPEELKERTDLPLYAALPELRDRRSVFHSLEAIRTLWVNLSFLKISREGGRIFCITSTIPGEGKSLITANLARTIAKGSGQKVLVVDLDMRRSRLHKLLQVGNEVGMSTLLSQTTSIEETIQKTEIENLDVISAGPQGDNPVGLILSFAFEPLLSELAQRYDYVLLDTPPVGLVSDAYKVMHLSDLTLFVLRAGLSKKSFLDEIEESHRREQIPMGLILNGVAERNEYGYYKRSEYLDHYLERKGRSGLLGWRL